jgi:hypothetical protein
MVLVSGSDLKWWRVLRTLDFCLDIVNGIGRLHLEGDSLTRKGFDEDLHGDLNKPVIRYVSSAVVAVMCGESGFWWVRNWR